MSGYPVIQETNRSSLAQEQIAAFLDDDDTLSAVQAAIDERWPNAILHEGGLSAALGALSHEHSPPILIVDISALENPNAGVRSLMALCDPETRVIAIGTTNDVAFYRKLTGLGVGDYLVKPFEPAALQSAIDNVTRPRAQATDDEGREKRTMISVIGIRGGIGATTVAVTTGWLLAHEHNQPTAILDLDLKFGTAGLQLDLEPSNGLREALEHPDRIDALFVASAMVNESENLYVLSAEEPLEEPMSFSAGAVAVLVDALPDDLKYVVSDVPVRVAVETPNLLARSDKIILVSDLSLIGMRDTVRFTKFCRSVAPTAVVNVVVNRAGIAGKNEIPKAEFAKGAELPLEHVIPFDPKLIALAANTGKPVMEVGSRTPTAKALRGLVADLVKERALSDQGADNTEKPKASLFSFSKKKK